MDAFDAKFQYFRLLREKAIRLARVSCPAYLHYVFRYAPTPMHNVWHEFMDKNREGTLLAFRGSGKSEQVTTGRSLWELGKNPELRIKVVTETDDLAGDLLSKMSSVILEDERNKEVFPDMVPADVGSWTKFKLTVKRRGHYKDASIAGSGVLTSTTGGRADIIFFDDIAGYRNTLAYPKLRAQVKEAFYSNWLNMSDGPNMRWYLVGTPWHEEDIVSELRRNPGIAHCQEFWVGDNFESPWPERYSDDFFRQKLATLGPRHYRRAFRGVALTSEESWVNAAAVDASRDFTLKPYDLLINPEVKKFVGVDLGHREGLNTCPTVIFVLGRLPNGKRVVLDVRILRRNEPLETARAIIRVWEDVKPASIFVENNGAQKFLVDILKSLTAELGLPIEGYYTGQQKLDLEIGVPSLLAEIETGQWIVPVGTGGEHKTDVCPCSFCYWMQEVKDYPNSHDDTLMASWLALESLRKVSERKGGGFSIWSFN